MAEEASTPQIVGRYEVLRELGRGGMAIVHLASQPDLNRHVALKELSRFHAGSAEFAHRFLRESRLAGSLNHPNIVTVYEYFEHDNIPYIAMEYVPRGSLRSYAKRLTLAQIAGVLEGVLAGLAHAEQAGIVHRDLKPENIMVTGDGRVKIADFGIARASQRAGTSLITITGMTVGTPTYMAPEQAMAGDIGPWTDLYSVGVMAYELVVGQVPFHDTDVPMVVLMRQVNEQIPSASSVRPGVDQALSDWIDQLLVKDPKLRTQSAVVAWDQLEEIIVNRLGPLWRRGARLLEDQRAAEGSRPLTPAPFESHEKLPTPAPTPVAPTPETTPAGPESSAPEPSAPEPSEISAEAPAEPYAADPGSTDAPAQPSGFVTFDPRRGGLRPPQAPVTPVPTPEPAVPTPEPPVPTPEPPTPEPPGPPPEAPIATPAEELPTPERELATPESSLEPPPPAADETLAPARAMQRETDEARSRAVDRVAGRVSRRGAAAAAALLAGVAAAVVGFVVSPSSNTTVTTTVPLSQRAAAGPLTVSYPSGWTKTDAEPPAAKSLRLAHAVTLAADKSEPGGALVVGTGSSRTTSLLPPNFLRVANNLPRASYVKLDGTVFKRYLNVLPSGTGQPESVYVMPTSKGIATAVCVDPTARAPQFAATCERAVGTLKTRGSRLSFGADPKYARTLSSIVSTLDRERVSLGMKLSSASTPKAQAAAAQRLAHSYRVAARATAKATPDPVASAANAAMAAALRRLADAYSALATAASRHKSGAYHTAGLDVKDGANALTHALVELRQAGYKVG